MCRRERTTNIVRKDNIEDKPFIPVYVSREGYHFCMEHKTYYYGKNCPICNNKHGMGEILKKYK